MDLVLTLIACPLLLCLAASLYFLARHLDAMRISGSVLTPIPSADRYSPMHRLLAEDDIAYLKRGGFTPRMIYRAKAVRRGIFRQYLRSFVKDYSRLLSGIRTQMAASQIDRPDLAATLARSQALFALGLVKVEMHLTLHSLGIGKVDISGLIGVLDTLREQADQLTSYPTAVPALS